MDAATLYRNLESNVLRRDRIGKRLKKSCSRSLKEEDLTKVVDQVRLLRTSRRALSKILSRLREIESFEGLEEPLSTIIEYMFTAGVFIEKEVLVNVAEVLSKNQYTKNYAEEIFNIDVVEIDKLSEDLKATYAVIKARLSA